MEEEEGGGGEWRLNEQKIQDGERYTMEAGSEGG